MTVYINGVRVHQTARGDVIVASGRKYVRVSARTGLARVVTHFVEMTVDQSWTVRVRRGGHRLLATAHSFILANDRVEFGLDQFQRPFLQPVNERQETIICRLGLVKRNVNETFLPVAWTGVDMSTPLLLKVAPEIDTNPSYRGRGAGRSASRPPLYRLTLRACHVCPPHIF